MKPLYIGIFTAIQVLGGLFCACAHFLQSPLLWLVSLLFLLPGSLLGWLQLLQPPSGGHWSLLTRGLMGILANVLLFVLAAFLLGGRRKKS